MNIKKHISPYTICGKWEDVFCFRLPVAGYWLLVISYNKSNRQPVTGNQQLI